MLKGWTTLILIISMSLTGFAQEKIKGNKNVITVETKIDDFSVLRFGDKLEIELIEGDEASVEIEADENLHDVIVFAVKDSILNLKTTAKIQSSKRLNITVYYTEILQKIEIDNDAELSAVNTINNKTLELRINDYARAFLNVKNNYFKLTNHNRSTFGISSKSKLNIESNRVTLALGENSKTDALIVTDSLTVDMYESAYAKIEGDSEYMNLNTTNSSDFSAKHLSVKTCTIMTEDSSDATIQVADELTIEASGSSEINIYGEPKITLTAFRDTSSIHKKKL